MPDLPPKKVGLIACSGEELAVGTLSRVAVRLVLEKLRPGQTTTLCLPLFLAGEKEERAFARFYPTIAIDGCEKLCAKRATEAYSAPVAGSLCIDQVLLDLGIVSQDAWRRELDAKGWAAAYALAEVIASWVDEMLGNEFLAAAETEEPAVGSEIAACSCGSGLPVLRTQIAGRPVEWVGVPAFFEQLMAADCRDLEAAGDELLRLTAIYNDVPPELAAEYRKELIRAYAVFLSSRAAH